MDFQVKNDPPSATLDQAWFQPNGDGFNALLSVSAMTVGRPLAVSGCIDGRYILELQHQGAVLQPK